MKKYLRSPAMTALLFVLAITLLFAGAIGGTQAALSNPSRNYYPALHLKRIGVNLNDNGLAMETSAVQIGKNYDCIVAATNDGQIPQYLRIVIHRYWVDAQGNKVKDVNFNPALIVTTDESGNPYNSGSWYWDAASSTPEREIYYYKQIVEANSSTDNLYRYAKIDPSVAKMVRIGTDGSYEYIYGNLTAKIDVEVDAVQTHNARAAMKSAWGVSDTVLNALNVPNE